MARSASRMIAAAAALIFVIGFSPALADDDDEAALDSVRRKTPSGEYIDPASFFRFHGYVSQSYTVADDDLGPASGGTPQILVNPEPNKLTLKNEGGFRNDAALFVGGEPFEGVGAVIEIHFVGAATNPVLTEAKMTWDLVGDGSESDWRLRLVGGRFWWPFGAHNGEWFSAINRFGLLSPAATEVVPAHYNEVGVMAEGEGLLGDDLGLNYVAAVGNGVPGFGLMGNVRGTEADTNDDRTVTGRLGLVYQSGLDLEVGVSFSSGALRSVEDPSLATDAAERYAADFSAFGPDIRVSVRDFSLRGYFYTSSEDLTGAGISQLDRSGMTLEPSYTLRRDASRFGEISLVARYSMSDEDTMAGGTLKRTQTGIGVSAAATSQLDLEVGYVSQDEDDDMPKLDNNAFTISLTSHF